MQRDCGDIIDRMSIAQLKTGRIKSGESKKEFQAFSKEFENIKIRFKQYDWGQIYEMMLSINSFIWQLESGLRSGKEKLKNENYLFDDENENGLSKIGTITILIRNINHLRVQLKNIINKLVGEGWQDKKSDHLSE